MLIYTTYVYYVQKENIYCDKIANQELEVEKHDSGWSLQA